MTKREDPDQIAWIDLVKDVIVLVRRSYMDMYIDLQIPIRSLAHSMWKR